MRILQVHNYYQQKGGEDNVVANEKKLLESAGHDVAQYIEHNSKITNIYERIRVAINCTYSNKQKERFLDVLKELKPDVVHVHNFFPLLTPSLFDACIENDTPSVLTLHNYRLICPGAMLMRNGRICEKCLQKPAYVAIQHRCYRDSFLATFMVSHMVEYHRKKHTWNDKVNVFIALTQIAKTKFIEGGLPAERIDVKPNFVWPSERSNKLVNEREGALYVGRLSVEKGIETLLEAWKGINIPLRIAGEGPLKDLVIQTASKYAHVEYLGNLTQEQVYQVMSRASFLVMPSECYEGFPMVLVEAMAHGLPVIGSNIGAMKEVIQEGVTGLHFEAGNSRSLRDAVYRMQNDPYAINEMSTASRREYHDKYSPEVNLARLLSIYDKAIEQQHK